MRMASVTGLGTAELISRYSLRRGSLLRFSHDGSCVFLRNGFCSIHSGRPLPCRLYPLGIESTAGTERFIRLEPAFGSIGVYAEEGTVGDFLDQQEATPYLSAVANYARLLPLMRKRIARLVDFERTEPAEFRRVAIREALAESGFDCNPLIDAIFDSDPWSGLAENGIRSPACHIIALRALIQAQSDALQLAAAAVLLAVSIGYTPADVITRL